MKYEVVIGLEVHVELATKSKIFCSCPAHSATAPNEGVCPACSGMPGMLPVANKKVIDLAMTAGMLLNCHINRTTTFDKKNYYYPDLPCAYQITQLFSPICVNGSVDIETRAGKKSIRIKQIHMEEDAGKLVHDDWSDTSLVDFNRTSVPLIEIVSQPDLRSAEEAIAYLDRLRTLLRFARVSDCEDSTMRCDVNLSVRPQGSDQLGVRTEMKNMNSTSAISRAIDFEIARHIDALERGTEVLVQETRHWDDVKGRSFSMRNKETAADYRYFPDPNLMPIVIDDAWFARIQDSLPELPEKKRKRYVSQYGLSEADSALLTQSRDLCDLFEQSCRQYDKPREIAAWLNADLANILKKLKKPLFGLQIAPDKLAAVVRMVSENEITRGAGRKVLTAVITDDVDPQAYCEEHHLASQGDEAEIRHIAERVVAGNPKAVQDYLGGKEKALQSLFGGVMRELHGNGDPSTIEKLLKEILAQQ